MGSPCWKICAMQRSKQHSGLPKLHVLEHVSSNYVTETSITNASECGFGFVLFCFYELTLFYFI